MDTVVILIILRRRVAALPEQSVVSFVLAHLSFEEFLIYKHVSTSRQLREHSDLTFYSRFPNRLNIVFAATIAPQFGYKMVHITVLNACVVLAAQPIQSYQELSSFTTASASA